MDTVQQFKDQGYVYLPGFLDTDNCRELTQELNKYIERGETTKDPQCPISEAVHGTVTFDTLLQDLLPHFEQACGKRLYPTYSYARLYKPGEELKKHTDRPACEISATITLGFEGDVWSIYMAGNKVDMQVGDAVLYRGMEVEHWREKYTEGQWQAQVFLHYVDADGPHADQKYDGRSSLGISKTDIPVQTHLTDCAVFEKHISNDFCDNLIKTYSQDNIEKQPPIIGESTIDKNIRDTERVLLPQNIGIGATLTATGLNANNYWWKYNITHANQTELLIYKPDGHYNPHVDTFHQHGEARKLTALAFLNDDYEGGKFFLNANGTLYYPPQKKGTVLVFPSYMIHGVEPVTKGVRYSCVTWLVGPYFK
jgi:predicted 2-oxoglutarate/Fe(II)-dependent dioxygenase YbiX